MQNQTQIFKRLFWAAKKQSLFLLGLMGLFLIPPAPVWADTRQQSTPQPTVLVTSEQLISFINNARIRGGIKPLKIHPILMEVAQSTADYMAINNMTDHIGNARDRAMRAGYGNGAIAWTSENFAMGDGENFTLENVRAAWDDPLHAIQMVSDSYTDIGAGIGVSPNGTVYCVTLTGYIEIGSSVSYLTREAKTTQRAATSLPLTPSVDPITQFIYNVQIATPDSSGKIVHVVRQGQSLWSIAIAYKTKIREIRQLNHLASDTTTLFKGQKLVIPTPNHPAATPSVLTQGSPAPGTSTPAALAARPSPLPSSSPTDNNPIETPAPVAEDNPIPTPIIIFILMGLLGSGLIIYGIVMQKR
jgi:LysM repeat protein